MMKSPSFAPRRRGGFLTGLPLVAMLCASPMINNQAHAQTSTELTPGGGHYTITQAGKSLGESQYSLAPISGGFTLSSSGHMSLGKFSYSFKNQATIDSSMNLVRDTLTGSVNGAKAHANNIVFDTSSDPTGRELRIHITADGKQTTNTVDRHRNLVLMPDLDAGAYMLMARFAVEQLETAWILIPKENGILVPALYKRDADVQAMMNGASVSVHHSTAELSDQNSITLELYYRGDGQLLEADLNAQNFYVVHDGFKLLQHPKPTPPPPGQAPQPGQQSPGSEPPQQMPPAPQP